LSEVAIRVENLSKRYQIGAKKSSSFRETLANAFRRRREAEAEAAEFWALKDVSFDIKRGEAIGIIGKNGAGKSTLLKVLSRITEPTRGRIEINGRVASLLEVGTGFHPELTGRENIFMNGTILGMTRREIRAKLDEIIDFSGVEKFIDTPVKRYSSGMYVRLAFAVAAHLEPEILIIDEVLAVGDASFQRKCLGKMGEAAKNGKTVLFVSHNLSQVKSLCQSGILLNAGRVSYIGSISRSINHYVSEGSGFANLTDMTQLPRLGQKDLYFSINWLKIENHSSDLVEGGELRVKIGFSNKRRFEEVLLALTIADDQNVVVACRSTASLNCFTLSQPADHVISANLPLNFKAGSYTINLGAACSKGTLEFVPSVTQIEVLPLPDTQEEWKKASVGMVLTRSNWLLESEVNQNKVVIG
jgi:lipopolysaccharide transport system ATP-binding protein